jgi:hypothetical protein
VLLRQVEHTAGGSHCIQSREIAPLFAERQASPYHQPDHPEDLWRYSREKNTRYVVVSDLFEKDMNLTYENAELKVYRIL